jgi:hypothetical protein
VGERGPVRSPRRTGAFCAGTTPVSAITRAPACSGATSRVSTPPDSGRCPGAGGVAAGVAELGLTRSGRAGRAAADHHRAAGTEPGAPVLETVRWPAAGIAGCLATPRSREHAMTRIARTPTGRVVFPLFGAVRGAGAGGHARAGAGAGRGAAPAPGGTGAERRRGAGLRPRRRDQGARGAGDPHRLHHRRQHGQHRRGLARHRPLLAGARGRHHHGRLAGDVSRQPAARGGDGRAEEAGVPLPDGGRGGRPAPGPAERALRRPVDLEPARAPHGARRRDRLPPRASARATTTTTGASAWWT